MKIIINQKGCEVFGKAIPNPKQWDNVRCNGCSFYTLCYLINDLSENK